WRTPAVWTEPAGFPSGGRVWRGAARGPHCDDRHTTHRREGKPPMDDRPSDPFAPVQIGPLRLRNAVIKAATSEGRSPDGLVTDDLIDFHLEYVRGGVGMTTVAYCCVSPEGRSAPGQILMGTEALPGLQRLT